MTMRAGQLSYCHPPTSDSHKQMHSYYSIRKGHMPENLLGSKGKSEPLKYKGMALATSNTGNELLSNI